MFVFLSFHASNDFEVRTPFCAFLSVLYGAVALNTLVALSRVSSRCDWNVRVLVHAERWRDTNFFFLGRR